VAIDIDSLYRKQPQAFVVCLRENGCDIAVPCFEMGKERVQFFSERSDARVFTVEITDENGVRNYKMERSGIEAAMAWLERKELESANSVPAVQKALERM